MSWRDEARRRVDQRRSAGLLREVRDIDGRGVSGTLDGRTIVNFASNDYLGLATHPRVVGAAIDAAERWGAGSGSARLIVGSRPVHTRLEEELAAWKAKEAALLFPSGYAANLGVLAALGTKDVLICSDELNHASIVDGCRLAGARVAVYPHRDLTVLEKLLRGAERAIVVTDAVFSMDGDTAPVDEIAELCVRCGALMVLDEAHSVLGPHPGATEADRIMVGTLSKFLGSSGGFAAADAPLIELLTNEARPFIFTTASTPMDAAAALAALEIFRGPEGEAARDKLRARVDMMKPNHPSPIIPVVLGTEEAAVVAAAKLLERGYLVPAIRPPSVAPGTSRLRITLSAAHEQAHVEGLARALDEVVGEWR